MVGKKEQEGLTTRKEPPFQAHVITTAYFDLQEWTAK